jgi:hypothetical protein
VRSMRASCEQDGTRAPNSSRLHAAAKNLTLHVVMVGQTGRFPTRPMTSVRSWRLNGRTQQGAFPR